MKGREAKAPEADRRPIEEILRAVRRGERDQFDVLMGPYRPLISDLVRNGLDDRLRSVLEPEDLMQDVMIAAYRGVGEAHFPNEAAFRRWLEALTRNRLTDLRRRHFRTQKRRTKLISLDETVDALEGLHRRDTLMSNNLSPSAILSRKEAAEALDSILALCRPKDRELLRMMAIDRIPIEEMAVRLGKKPGAVRKALTRALAACRKAIRRAERDESRGSRS